MVSKEIVQFMDALLPAGIDAFSPAWIFKRFNKCIETYGLDIIVGHRVFGKLRDLQAGALFALGLSKSRDSKEHWVASASEHERTPDVYLYSSGQHPILTNGLRLEKLNVELKEWDYRNGENLEEYLEKLLAKKNYPENFHIVIYTNKQGRELNLPSIATKISRLNISRAWLWLLTTADVNSRPDDYVLACLNREPGQIDFNLREELRTHEKQLPAVKFHRGVSQDIPKSKDIMDVSLPILTREIREVLFKKISDKRNARN